MMKRLSWIAIAAGALVFNAAAEPPDTKLLLEGGGSAPASFTDDRADERARMVEVQIAGRGVSDERVLEAMHKVPRHAFVPDEQKPGAYGDRPLPIGHGQTISQPYIVGFMSEELDVERGDRVLEVGTGSGYQAAVLAAMGVEVVSIEIIGALARRAAAQLERLDFGNVTVIHGDGYYGYPEKGPYDAIIVTAAAEHVPPPLVEQLKPKRRMVIPVGRAGWTQNLLRVEKTEDGEARSRNLMAVVFVPLTGDH
ncbi:protein-L-isoaspartate(D-aspartate) O-methyltransferase [Wenzhouxiangella sp. XN201]|uniref:protein-L-isoaspartate(D-aspartate) O-methyltransferase n=1 Tax=Wenzhouxiangella sp. XN201 TaxID=2710755 RepID=UPI0013C5A676|nr:protein-L-isoaspartate(D-aspartate) O-methyltransferase [Wenzhouxiangella sp. XN201]NEZ04306.1 protein-L-isoaspartate(D-aspartate) O-methyltransferase [Wenzhouxiangella sp. XN201]